MQVPNKFTHMVKIAAFLVTIAAKYAKKYVKIIVVKNYHNSITEVG